MLFRSCRFKTARVCRLPLFPTRLRDVSTRISLLFPSPPLADRRRTCFELHYFLACAFLSAPPSPVLGLSVARYTQNAPKRGAAVDAADDGEVNSATPGCSQPPRAKLKVIFEQWGTHDPLSPGGLSVKRSKRDGRLPPPSTPLRKYVHAPRFSSPYTNSSTPTVPAAIQHDERVTKFRD